MGFPIRRFLDQSSFAAPQGISQRTTSFIASQRQGIHQMLLRHLITLMIDVRALGRGQTRYKRKTCLRISPKTIFACQAYAARPAAGRGWFAELGCPLAAYAASLRFQTSASLRRRRESHDKIHRPKADGHRIQTQPRQGCTTKTMVEPVGIEPTT